MRTFVALLFFVLIVLLVLQGCATNGATSSDPCKSSVRGGNVDRLCAGQGR